MKLLTPEHVAAMHFGQWVRTRRGSSGEPPPGVDRRRLALDRFDVNGEIRTHPEEELDR